MNELLITDSEYKDIFVKTIVDKVGLEPTDIGIAYAEYEAFVETVGPEHIGDPQYDADECLSYWSE